MESGFFETHKTALLVYPIELEDGVYKFANSGLIARYFYATALLDEGELPENQKHFGLKLLHKIFTGKTDEGIILQSHIGSLSESEAKAQLKAWLKEFGATENDLEQISKLEKSETIKNILTEVKDIAETKVHIKGIPTLLYENQKHLGLYEK